MALLSVFFANVLCSLTPCFPTYAPPVISESADTLNEDVKIIEYTEKNRFVGQETGKRGHREYRQNDWPIVETQAGKVQGYPMRTVGGKRIFAFEGIPFAEPPLGYLRFRGPVKKKPWNETLITMNYRTPHCIQIDLSKAFTVTGNEDCLHLSVFTPKIPDGEIVKKKNLVPVFVFFFGGAYMFGSKDQYGPSYLLDKDDVLLVTMNFRLGALGFLSTGDQEASGNWGLKDQNLGLQWVRDNIDRFGGDPNAVTLIGQSAGSSSVHLHILSKKSRGLFRAGISQSGTALNPWSVLKKVPKTTRKLARLVNCDRQSNKEMIECLRRIPASRLTAAQTQLFEWMNHPAVNFAPVVEPEGPDAFLTETPRALYKRGDVARVPWIAGFVPDEGNIYNILMMLNPLSFYSFNRNFDSLAPMTLGFRGLGLNETAVAEKIRHQYFGTQEITHNNLKDHSDMYGDRTLLKGIYEGMQAHSRWAPTYGYFFNYTGKFSILTRTGMTREESGISHYDDIIYIFNSTEFHPSLSYSDPDYLMTEFMVDLWTNFAKLLVPLHTNKDGEKVDFWRPVNATSRDFKILEINRKPEMIPFPSKYLKRIQFWESLKIPE